jgi:hypothetical protein
MQEFEQFDMQRSLDKLKGEIEDKNSFVHLKGLFKLTKTERAWVDTVAVRDRNLEKDVHEWISSRSSHCEIIDRYSAYDPTLHSRELPRHYPLRMLYGVGSVCSGKNIFMFFPNAFGLVPDGDDDVFGLEFIDVWSNIFRRSVFECVKRTFAIQDQIRVTLLLEANLERTIYLSSIFHEIGHRVGPYRVSPSIQAGMDLTEFQTDVFGELATDSMLISNLKEFPEVALFIITQRLFWFGRRGYIDNPLSANINNDNDAWIGAFLWTRLRKTVIEIKDGKLHLDPTRIEATFRSIVAEIDQLAHSTCGSPNQKELVYQWMANQVPCARGRFFLPEELRAVFAMCQEVPEVPHFQPMFLPASRPQGAIA